MRIGVVSAFGQESKPLRSRLTERGREMVDEFVFFLHRHETIDVTAVRTGQGIIRGARGTQLLLDRYGSQIIINCGVAGAIAPHCRVGDVVISEGVVEYDEAEAGWQKTGFYQADPEMIQTAHGISNGLPHGNKVTSGIIVSGDHVIDSNEKKEALWKHFRGLCVEQEGAGVASICDVHNIPWIVIRGISDLADEHVISDFKKNVELAAHHASLVTFEMIQNLLIDPPVSREEAE